MGKDEKALVFIFTINNEESAYAKSLNYIDKIVHLDHFFQNEPINAIDVGIQGCLVNENLSIKNIIESVNSDKQIKNELIDKDKLNRYLINKKPKIVFLFNVRCKTENIVNLRYISLLQDSMEKVDINVLSPLKLVFHIEFETEADYFRASPFLFCENMTKNGYYEHLYFTYNGKTQKAQINGIYNLKKIAPLIKITKENYFLFSKSVEEIFTDFEFDSREPVLDFRQRVEAECPELEPHKIYEIILKNTCQNYLLESRLLAEISTDSLFKKCSKISFLSFFLFSALYMFIFENKERESKASLIEIDTLIQEAQNFADGILQLMENAVSYSESSYFSFRVYRFGAEKYLEKVYPSFVFDDDTYYLEVLITDLNTSKNIVNKFKENLDFSYDVDDRTKEEIKETFALRDFFKPAANSQKLWDKLYNTGKNAAFHYGLQIFDTIINSASGYFCVTSSTDFEISEEDIYIGNYNKKKDMKDETNYVHFPGTNYRILMPLRMLYVQKSLGINMSLSYTDLKEAVKQTEIRISSEDILKALNDQNSSELNLLDVEEKKAVIEGISELLIEKLNFNTRDSELLYIINVNNINKARSIEIFSKALVLFLLSRQKMKKKCNIALIDCSQEFMLAFTRCFAIFYNKMGKCPVMKNHQIYLCSTDLVSEFLFAGEDIASVQYSADYLSNSKGVFNYCLDIVGIVSAKRANVRKASPKAIKITPFDVIVSDKQYTLFEKRVQHDLLKNMQEEEFGCCLNDVHVRIGSKIHFSDRFFEAALLFNSSYYTSRFAYLLAKQIITQEQQDKIVLVGYETYSEILVYEVKKAIKDMYGIDCRYIIYEQKEAPIFKHWEDSMVDSNFVIIVPINSTLTTHSKIIAELKKRIEIKEIIRNFAVVLIRDSKTASEEQLSSLEREYWEDIHVNERRVIIKTAIPNEVTYFICVNNQWEEPYECSCCFPKESLIHEKPILQVNKPSVVPMVMVGLKPERKIDPKNISFTEGNSTNCKNFEFLKDALDYGHFERRDNHFQYYFRSEKIFSNAKSHESFAKWIDTTRKVINSQKAKLLNTGRNNIYDIIVAPIHQSNAAFVEEINDQVFNNASIIVNLDGEREFRDNVKTKYSNLTSLYNNILSAQRSAVINFHFVDDTIVSGKTFNRAKSLMHSLFPQEAFHESNLVKVNLFKNVIILLNRCSKSTKYSYVEDDACFMSFINLSIPSMRNHKDACILCKLVKDCEKLYKQSSCNEMAEHWHKKFKKYSINRIQFAVKAQDIERKERAFRRIVCTHNAFSCLDKIGNYQNDNDLVRRIIYYLINNNLEDESIDLKERMEYLISYIKVLSRPFLIFRKSVLEEIFKFILSLLEYLISNDEERDDLVNVQGFDPDLIKIMQFVSDFEKREEKPLIEVLLKTLISRLSGLNAKYIIRCRNIHKIISYFRKLSSEETKNTEFLFWYANAIKKLIGLSNDASLCLWFEHVLVKQYEYKMEQNKLNIGENAWEILYLENIYILYEGVSELSSKYNTMNTAIQEYYFENFRRMINVMYNGNMQDNKELILFPEVSSEPQNNNQMGGNDLGNIIKAVVDYNRHLESEGNYTPIDASDYYNKLLDIIALITNANYTVMYGQDQFACENPVDDNCHTEDSFYQIAKAKNRGQQAEKKQAEDKRILLEISSDATEMVKRVRDTVFYFTEKNNIIFVIKLDYKYYNVRTKNVNDLTGSLAHTIDPTFILLYFAKGTGTSETEQIKEIFKKIRYILTFRHKLVSRLKNDFSNNLFMKNEALKKDIRALSNDKAANHATYPFLQVCCETALSIAKENDCNSTLAAKTLQLGAHSLISKLYAKKVLRELRRQKFSLIKGFKEPISLSILNNITYDRSGREVFADVEYTNAYWRQKITYAQDCYHYIVYFIIALVENALKHSQLQEASDKIKIEMYQEGKYLVIRNPIGLRNKNKEETGITLETLEEYFQVVYNDEIVTDEDEYYFMVKLPLYKNKK